MTKAGRLRRQKKRRREIAIAKISVGILLIVGFGTAGMIERHPAYGLLSAALMLIGYIIGYIEIPGFAKGGT